MDLTEDLPSPAQHSSQSIAQAAALISQLSDVIARRRDRAPRHTPSADPQTGLAIPEQTIGGRVDASAAALDTYRLRADGAPGATTGKGTTVDPVHRRIAALDSASKRLGVADTEVFLSAEALTEARDAITTAGQAFSTSSAAAPQAAHSIPTGTTQRNQTQTRRNR